MAGPAAREARPARRAAVGRTLWLFTYDRKRQAGEVVSLAGER